MSIIHRIFGAVVSSPWGAAALKAYAFRTPHFHLTDLNGEVYMGRWRVVNEGSFGGRILKALTGYSSVRLHHIKRPDHDRDLHNHPFAYRTFIVQGFYAEHYEENQADFDGLGWVYKPVSGRRIVFRGDTATGDYFKFHRISDVGPQGVWTLFFMTGNQGTWGFRTDKGFVNSVKYLLRKGYDHESIRDFGKDKES